MREVWGYDSFCQINNFSFAIVSDSHACRKRSTLSFITFQVDMFTNCCVSSAIFCCRLFILCIRSTVFLGRLLRRTTTLEMDSVKLDTHLIEDQYFSKYQSNVKSGLNSTPVCFEIFTCCLKCNKSCLPWKRGIDLMSVHTTSPKMSFFNFGATIVSENAGRKDLKEKKHVTSYIYH